MKYLLVGGSGILGSGFREALAARGDQVVRLRPPWADTLAASAYLADRVGTIMARADPPEVVIWAAGVGVVAAHRQAMAAETSAVAALVGTLLSVPAQGPATLLFASSAGAVYAGCGSHRIAVGEPTAPVSAYGFEKLQQEDICADLAQSPRWRVMIARYSNIYGLANGVVPSKGLLDASVRAVRTGDPLPVYVNPDSRRDYIHNVDAARVSLDLLAGMPAQGRHTRIVASGHTLAVSSVLSTVSAVARRRVPALFADRAYSSLQPRTIWLSPCMLPAAATPMPVVVHRMLQAPLSPQH